MFYYLVRPLARLGTYLFFRKIYFSNVQRIPPNKPVIIAINHPTGFMEPIIMAVLMRQGLHFLVRGDFFSKKIYGTLLRALHMIPIFRMRDKTGFGGVKTNFSTFEACFESLKSGKIIMIFPEGSAIHEKRLRPLQRGLIRIAFGTLERYPDLEDLYVVPVGANFLDALQARSEVMINFGEPLRARNFYRSGEASEGDALLEALERAMRQQVVVVNDPQDDQLFEQMITVDRSNRGTNNFPIVEDDTRNLEADKSLAEYLNGLNNERKNVLRSRFATYFKNLSAHKLEDRALVSVSRRYTWVWLILGFVPACMGRLFAFLPTRLAAYIKVNKVRRLEYKMPIWACANWLLFVLYYLIWFFAAAISGQWWILLAAMALGALSYLGLLYFEFVESWQQIRRFKGLSPAQKDTLLAERQALLPLLQNK